MKGLDFFMAKWCYRLKELIVRNFRKHPVHYYADRGNAAASFKFPQLCDLAVHMSEIAAGKRTGNIACASRKAVSDGD